MLKLGALYIKDEHVIISYYFYELPKCLFPLTDPSALKPIIFCSK